MTSVSNENIDVNAINLLDTLLIMQLPMNDIYRLLPGSYKALYLDLKVERMNEGKPRNSFQIISIWNCIFI